MKDLAYKSQTAENLYVWKFDYYHIAQLMRDRDYPVDIFTTARHDADAIHRQQALEPKALQQANASMPLICITSTPYNPGNQPIKQILQNNWHILETD